MGIISDIVIGSSYCAYVIWNHLFLPFSYLAVRLEREKSNSSELTYANKDVNWSLV